MLHVWLVPALVVLFLIITCFYLIVKFTSGTGVRNDGKTLVDKPVDEEEPPAG